MLSLFIRVEMMIRCRSVAVPATGCVQCLGVDTVSVCMRVKLVMCSVILIRSFFKKIKIKKLF